MSVFFFFFWPILGSQRQPGVLEFVLVALTSIVEEPSPQVLKTFFLSFTLVFKVSRKEK